MPEASLEPQRKQASPWTAGVTREHQATSAQLAAPESRPRQSPALSLQRAIGNQALGRMLQAKLTISEPGDIYEQEADRVAEHVMRMPSEPPNFTDVTLRKIQLKGAPCESSATTCPKSEDEEETPLQRKQTEASPATAPPSVHEVLSTPGEVQQSSSNSAEVEPTLSDQVMRMPDPVAVPAYHPAGKTVVSLQRKCAECEEEEKVQRKEISSEPATAPPIVHEVLSSPGQPLDPATRAFFKPRFAADFSQVRLHTDARAAESARAVNALAYTVGRHIVFAAGQYSGSSPGVRLIAHELSHTIQQGTGVALARPTISQPRDSSSREVEAVSNRVLLSQPLRIVTGRPLNVSRQHSQDPSLLQSAKARFYQNLIDSMRIPQRAAIEVLRGAASHAPASVRSVVDTIIDVIEFLSGLVIQLIEAIVALNVGIAGGLVSLAEGLLRISVGLLRGVTLHVWARITGDVAPLPSLPQWLRGVYETILAILAGVKTLVNAWLAEFKSASIDRQTIMIGELAGQIIALLLPVALTGGGAAAGAAGGVEASETAGVAGTAVEVTTGASRVTSTGVRLTAISGGGSGTAEATAEVATGTSRVTSTGARLVAVSEVAESSSTTVASAASRGSGAASEAIYAGARGPAAEGTSALKALDAPLYEPPLPPPVRIVPPIETPAPVPELVPASVPSTTSSAVSSAALAGGSWTKIAVGAGTGAAAAADTATKAKPESPKCTFPTGSKTDPIHIIWFKHPEGIWYPQSIEIAGHKYARTAKPSTLPHGEPIGVKADYWPKLDKPLQLSYLTPEEKRTRGKDRFRRLLASYGYDWQGQGLDADHIQDTAWGGPDEPYNLWPMGSEFNQLAGTCQNSNQLVNFCLTKNGPPMNMSLQQIRDANRYYNLWFKIAGYRDPTGCA